MKYFSIRPFKGEDIDFAHKLDVMEQWNHTRNDVERILVLNQMAVSLRR